MDEIHPRQPEPSHQSCSHAKTLDERDRDGEAEQGQPEQTRKDEERREKREGNEDQHTERVGDQGAPAPEWRPGRDRARDDIAECDQERPGRGGDDLP